MKSISEFMKLEHDSLIKQWEAFSFEKNKEKSRELLEKFSDSLLKHVNLEDGALSPAFNKDLKLEKGVGQSAVMSSDHADLEKLLANVKMTLEGNNKEKFKYAKTHFERALIKHQNKEEETHYVFFDKIISKEEWEEILMGKS